jgi:hypothetical protein
MTGRPPIPDPDGVYAGQVKPGDCVRNPETGWQGDDREVLDVMAVSGPDQDGMVFLHAPGGPPVRVAGDWGLERYTGQQANQAAFLLIQAAEDYGMAGGEER